MFELVVMPLMELWADGAENDDDDLREGLQTLQDALSQHLGYAVSWDEKLDPSASYQADGVDPYCVYALRAAAAWLEFEDDLESFDVGDEPWDHEALSRLEDKGRSDRFPQLMHSEESDCAAFAPIDLPDVFAIEDDDESDFSICVGSLTALRRELDELRVALKMEEGLEEHIDDLVFDPSEDPKAGPRYGWLVFSTRVDEALRRSLPLLVLTVPLESDDEWED